MRAGRAIDRRALGYAVALGALLAASLAASVFARDMVEEAYPEYSQPFTSWFPASTGLSLALVAVTGVAIAAVSYLLFTRFEATDRRLSRPPLAALPLGFSRRDVLRAAALVFLFWLPIVIIMYPTGITADTFNQLYQFQTAAPTYYPTTNEMIDAEFIDHHPVFDTLLYGLFWQAGSALGSQNAGIFALTFLQSAVLAIELGALVCYLDRLGVPYPLRFASLAFVALFPLFGHYAATIVKDTTYLTAFVPWSIMWMETVRTRGRSLDRRSFLAAFFLLGGLCILTKKLGLLLLAGSLAVLAVMLGGHRLKVVAGSAVTFVVSCALLPAIVYPAIGGVAPGGRQEALSPAIQQMTALFSEDSAALSDNELADVNKVFNVKRAVRAYEPFRTDPAKSTFKDSATTDDILRFLEIWGAQGLKHPLTYLTSTVQTSGMLYIPIMKMTYYSGNDMSSRARNYAKRNPDFAVDIAQPEALIELNDYLEFDSPESKVSDLPVISLFFTEGFYGGWVPVIALVTTLYARRGRRAERPGEADDRDADDATGRPLLATGLAPTTLCMLFLLVSPVASPRYVLPLLFTAPLILGWAWFSLKTRAAYPFSSS